MRCLSNHFQVREKQHVVVAGLWPVCEESVEFHEVTHNLASHHLKLCARCFIVLRLKRGLSLITYAYNPLAFCSRRMTLSTKFIF
jgi:hypothetical protein